MKRIPLTRGKVAIVDTQDYDYLRQWTWCVNSEGYAIRGEKRRHVYLHKIVARRKGLNARKEIDHVNRVRLDNRRRNLRVATCTQQRANTSLRRDNTSGYKGVIDMGRYSKRTKPWHAYIRCKRRRQSIGYFLTAIAAEKAYNKRASELFGPFAWLNPF